MHWINRIVVAALLAAALAWVPRGFYEGAGADDLGRVQNEREALNQANARLREQIRLLRAEVDALKNDPQELERIAREDLNLVRPGEVVFEVEHVEGSESP